MAIEVFDIDLPNTNENVVLTKKSTVVEKENLEIKTAMKTRFDVIYEKTSKLYKMNTGIVSDMYVKVFKNSSTFKYTLSDLLSDYDEYLQSILIKICILNDRFEYDELNFIENLCEYGKLLDGTDLTMFASCSKDMRNMLSEKADARLKVVPICFKLAGAVDLGREIKITKTLLDNTVKIGVSLKMIDDKCNISDNTEIITALKSIYIFAKENGVSLK